MRTRERAELSKAVRRLEQLRRELSAEIVLCEPAGELLRNAGLNRFGI